MQHQYHLLINGDQIDVAIVQGTVNVRMHGLYEPISTTLDFNQRGYHNIEDELVFRSNPDFVFHDSCGFESGGENEFTKMKKFVMDRASTTKLKQRIHAIWQAATSVQL
jgi:hypothetical protein